MVRVNKYWAAGSVCRVVELVQQDSEHPAVYVILPNGNKGMFFYNEITKQSSKPLDQD